MARARGVIGVAAGLVILWMAGAAGCGSSHPEPGGPPGGSGPPEGGGGSGGGSGGGTTPGGGGSGSDGSGGAGGGSGSSGGDACSGLVASFGDAAARRFARASNEGCWRATSSPGGQVALGVFAVGRGTGTVTFHLYPPDGSAEQGTIAVGQNDMNDVDPWFHWTSAGWAGRAAIPMSGTPYPPMGLGAFDDRGNRIGLSRDPILSSAPDGHGGSIALGQTVAPGPTGPIVGPTMLEWLDAYGALVRSATIDPGATMLLSSWGTGHVLVLGGSPLRARWYDGQGTPLTPSFDAVPSVELATLHLLVDGSIALGDAAGWRGVFRDGVAAMDPPPAWLAARPRTRLATIRGGGGYAVLPYDYLPGRPAADRTTFEIVTASGDSCGTMKPPAAPAEAGVTRTTTGIDVGQDGTVFEKDELARTASSSGNDCEFRWWPGLLR